MVILKLMNTSDGRFNVAFEDARDAAEFEEFLNNSRMVLVQESYTVPLIEIPAESMCDHMWEYMWNADTKTTDRKCLRKDCGCLETGVTPR